MKCSICGEEELPSCEECGDEFTEGDLVYCMVLGKHSHRDCLGLSKARTLR